MGPVRTLLLLLFVVGGMGCSLFSDAEVPPDSLEDWQVAARRAELEGEMMDSLPASPAWSFTGAHVRCDRDSKAVLLHSGKVLVVGGYRSVLGASEVRCAELYDPATGVWSPTGSMDTARGSHQATLLPDGRVLVSGGSNESASPIGKAEVYDPASGTWSETGSLNSPRRIHTATLLVNGTVLVVGGVSNGTALATAEVYDPAAGTWRVTGSLFESRYAHTATLLLDGTVLIVGGVSNGTAGRVTEMLGPTGGPWGRPHSRSGVWC